MEEKLLKRKVKTYKKNHTEEFIGDAERSKIKRDKAIACKREKALQRAMNELDEEDYEAEAINELKYSAKKAHGNAKTHKKRYKELKEADEFF